MGNVGFWLGHRLSQVLGLGLLGVQLAAPLSVVAADLQSIRQRGYLIVAIKDNLRPLAFRDGAGQLQGLEIEIARRLAQELLGRSEAIVFKPVDNRDRLRLLLDNQADVVIARVTATQPRTRLVNFSSPYYLDRTSLITKSLTIQRLEDLGQQKVAVLKGSSTIASLRYQMPGIELVGVDSYEAGKVALDSGRVVAFAADTTVLVGWMQEFPDYRLLPSLPDREALCIVLPKGLQYEDLRRQVNAALTRWQSEGWLQQQMSRWGLPYN